jgi:hypothetical protein
MLGMLDGPQAPDKALDVLLEFLKDPTILIYTGSEVKANWTGKEKSTVTEKGMGDGRVMAVQALDRMGVQKLISRPDIIQELQKVARDTTWEPLRKDTQNLLAKLKKK